MENNKLSIMRSLSFGLKALLHHGRLAIGSYLIGLGLMAAFIGVVGLLFHFNLSYQSFYDLVSMRFESLGSLSLKGFLGLSLVRFLIVGYWIIGIMQVGLDIYDKGKSSISRFFPSVRNSVRNLVFSLIPLLSIIGVIFLANFVFLVLVPYLVVAVTSPPNLEAAQGFFDLTQLLFRVVLNILGLPVMVYLAIKWLFYPAFIIDKRIGPVKALYNSALITKGARYRLFFILIAYLLIFYVVEIGSYLFVPFFVYVYVYIYRTLLKATINKDNQESLAT